MVNHNVTQLNYQSADQCYPEQACHTSQASLSYGGTNIDLLRADWSGSDYPRALFQLENYCAGPKTAIAKLIFSICDGESGSQSQCVTKQHVCINEAGRFEIDLTQGIIAICLTIVVGEHLYMGLFVAPAQKQPTLIKALDLALSIDWPTAPSNCYKVSVERAEDSSPVANEEINFSLKTIAADDSVTRVEDRDQTRADGCFYLELDNTAKAIFLTVDIVEQRDCILERGELCLASP